MALRARLGVRLSLAGCGPERLRDVFDVLDASFDALWVADDPSSVLDDDELEAVTTLGAAAVSTTGLTLGVLPTLAGARPPGVLVKQATTLDVLSGGRAALALAPPPGGGAALEQALVACRELFVADVNRPAPLSRGGPPVLVDLSGGGGDKAAGIDVAARLGDGCVVAGTDEDSAALFRDRCRRTGRAVPLLAVVPVGPGPLSTDDVRRTVVAADGYVLDVVGPSEPGWLTELGESARLLVGG